MQTSWILEEMSEMALNARQVLETQIHCKPCIERIVMKR